MAKDVYGSFGSVPKTSPGSGGDLQYSRVNASPEDFGAQVGRAAEYAGKVQEKVGLESLELLTKAAQQDSEAKANDDYANKYVPTATQLRNEYDALDGQDKVHGHQKYITDLQALNESFISTASSPYEQRLKRDLSTRRMAAEQENASRELAAAQQKLSVKAQADKLLVDMGYAASNYNNPAVVRDVEDSIDGSIDLQAIDQDLRPDDPEVRGALTAQKEAAKGQMAVGMIDAALKRGDAPEANKIRAQYGAVIPGHQQLYIDSVLWTENMRQTSFNTVDALLAGGQLPEPVGMPPVQVQALVAEAAEGASFDVNSALTVAMIESSMGQNLGSRGDIGQTGKGGEPPEQAKNMVEELKRSQDIARNSLGREPESWETYICYQQGAGGGPALLKASMDNPNAKAIDVLAPLYKNKESAYSAIVHNGGNATMTSGDYLAFIKAKYKENAGRALCVVPEPVSAVQDGPVGEAVLASSAPRTISSALKKSAAPLGQTMQPGATPLDAQRNFDAKYGGWLEQANAIPNESVRAAVISELNSRKGVVAAKASAYGAQIKGQAEALQYNDNFVSLEQVPSELRNALQKNYPKEWNDLRLAAVKNRGGPDNPAVFADITVEVNSIFPDGKPIPPGRLDDALRLQNKIVGLAESGELSGDVAKGMVKTIQVGLASAASGERKINDTWLVGDDHYEKALRAFKKSGASVPEVNRMFMEYVQTADKYKFNDKTAADTAYFLPDDANKAAPVTPTKVISAIKNKQAESRYESLIMLERPVNSVIGQDGSSMVISDAKPEGAADTTLDLDLPIMEYNGKQYIVHPDGMWEQVGQ